jgi:hypothetical protein
MRLTANLVLLMGALLLVGCFDPGLTSKDKRFEGRLDEFLNLAPIGEQSPAATRALLTDLFGVEVQRVCMIGGSDWAGDVALQWTGAETPIPVENLRDVGSGDLDADGLVALIGIDAQSNGYVRRGWLGSVCAQNAGPVCWSVDDQFRMSVVADALIDNGPDTGQHIYGIQFARDGQRSCPIGRTAR